MKDEIKEIEEWLRDISTPTGLSYSGDRTLSNSMVDHIIDYTTNLQKEKDKYKNVIDKIDKLINTDYGWISYYYKYNNKYLKSEIKEDINKLLEEVE